MRLKTNHFFGLLFIALIALGSCRNEANKIAETCFDEVRNQGELRVDCGGPNCDECPPTCEDGIANQDEQSPVLNSNVIGIDCGGESCEPCATCDDGIQNAHWVRDLNLTMDDIGQDSVGVSMNGVMYRLVMETGIDCGFPCPEACAPACDDGIQNGDEAGVDCGGSCGDPCPPPTCNDGIQNGTETGIDCGDGVGPLSQCGPCPDNSCMDGIQNIHTELTEELPQGYITVVETGIDCDNSTLTMCPDCPVPTCFDGIQNGSETGVDCGGACQTQCDPTISCSNGIMDGDETGVDCDNDDTTPCPPCATCNDGIKNGPEFMVDCLDYPIAGFESCDICPSCHDGIQTDTLGELDVDCGGPNCDDCFQELVIDEIDGSSFRDQYSYNLLIAESGNDDTLALDPNQFPGLKATRVQGNGFAIDHLRIEANQGFETGSVGLIVRTVVLYLPYPDQDGDFQPIDLFPWDDVPEITDIPPIELEEEQLPYMTYREQTINGSQIDSRYRSYVIDMESSQLEYTYDFGGTPDTDFEVYTKGGINQGGLQSTEDFITSEVDSTTFNDLTFKVQYDFFE